MAQSYTRQSSFADGDTITAALFNNEYNQLVNAFSYSSTNEATTGHRHNGSAGEGGNIPQIGDLDFLNKIVVDSTNNRWGFYVEVSSVAVEQVRLQDGALIPVTDSDVDLGTSSLYFKDAYIDSITTTGNVDVGGNLTVTGTTTFNGGTITMGDAATDNVVFGADVDSNIIPDDDNTYDLGSASQEWRNLYIDGTANIDSLVADTADINGGTIDGAIIGGTTAAAITGTTITGTSFVIGSADISEAELEILDGATVTTDELNILDGVTSTTAEINLLDGVTATTAELNILGGVTSTATELNLLDGVTSTTAELNILDGVTATATEINLLDGKTFLDEDNMASNSATGIASQQSIKAYVDTQITAEDLDITTDSGTIAIDLDSETLTVSGGTGLDSSATGNAVTLAIDSSVTTLTGSQTLTNKTLTSPDVNTPDIDGGTIDGATIATSDVTVGAGKTLDVSSGTLTLADDQISGDKVEGGTIAATTITDLTFGSLNDGTITVTAFADEDDMSSDSATLVPTQQSVKAYVDSQVTAQDLDFQGDTGGALSIDLDSESLTIAGGTGLDTVGSGNTVTVNIDSTVATLTGTQTLTNKTLTTPIISSISNTGTLTLPTSTDTLVGRATTDTLTNKTLTSPVINTGVSGTAFLDDDTFATATASTLASSESIKAYVDTTVAATNEVVEDTTPQLGGDLDLNSSDITGTGNINITGTIQSSGNITGTLATAAQPNITSVGTLTGLNVAGTPTFDGLTVDGTGSFTQSSNAATALTTFTNSNAGASARASISFASDTGSSVVGTVSSGWTVDALNANETFMFGSNGVSLFAPASQNVRILAGGSERMRIDSSGNVGIGTDSPVKQLTLAAANTSTVVATALNHGASNYWGVGSFTDQSFRIAKSHGLEDANTYFVIDRSNGNVGIGLTNPSDYYATDLVVSSASEKGITIASTATSNANYLMFADGTSGDQRYRGYIGYGHSNDHMAFATAGTEKMRIDSSGSLLVNKTASGSLATAGFEFASNNTLRATKGSSAPAEFNRLTNDGDIAIFYKDTSSVGSIGTASGDLHIDGLANHSGIRFQAQSLLPRLNGSDTDNSIDLGYDDGSATHRFRNLYLSSGIYVGGSGSANHLDDYEEGTWTPTTGPGSSQGYEHRSGNYTKVGRLVTAYFGLKHNAGTFNASEALIGGLPFAVQTTGSFQEPMFIITTVGNAPTSQGGNGGSGSFIPGEISFYISGGESQGRGRDFTTNTDNTLFADQIFDSNSFIKGTIIYYTA